MDGFGGRKVAEVHKVFGGAHDLAVGGEASEEGKAADDRHSMAAEFPVGEPVAQLPSKINMRPFVHQHPAGEAQFRRAASIRAAIRPPNGCRSRSTPSTSSSRRISRREAWAEPPPANRSRRGDRDVRLLVTAFGTVEG